MQDKHILGKWEITLILINCVICKLFTGFTRFFEEISGTAQLLTVLMICIAAIIAILIITQFYKKFEGKDIIDVASIAMGKFGRNLTGIIIILYLIFAAMITMREFIELTQTVSFHISPAQFLGIFFWVVMLAGGLIGMHSIARLHVIIVPIIMAITAIIVASILPLSDTSNFFPILGTGASKAFGTGFFTISIFADFIILFLLNPFFANGLKMRKIGLTSAIWASVFIILIPSAFLMLYPYPITNQYNMPIYPITKLISYGRFFERIDAIFTIYWTLSAMLYLALLLFIIIHVFKKIFSLPKARPMAYCFSTVIFTLAMITGRLSRVYFFMYNSIFFTWAVAFILPLVFLIIASLRQTRRKGGILDEAS